MSGFSADWLLLREPADHRARAPDLTEPLRRHLSAYHSVNVLDLGCGTGSNLRALTPALPAIQHWTLVDYDPALLDAARAATEAWQAEAALTDLTVDFRQADLRADLDALLEADVDLVTAAALFDLVSEDWIERFVAGLAARRLPLYTVLIYDGGMRWDPAHPADGAITAAFNAHQRLDKGFGAAAGPNAALSLADASGGERLPGRDGEEPLAADAPGIAADPGDGGRYCPGRARDRAGQRGRDRRMGRLTRTTRKLRDRPYRSACPAWRLGADHKAMHVTRAPDEAERRSGAQSNISG